jgi:hypothetical protein
MRNVLYLFALILLTAACQALETPQPTPEVVLLNYEIKNEGRSLILKEGGHPQSNIPKLLVFTSPEEIEPPNGTQFNQQYLTELHEVDYERYFVILVMTDHNKDSRTVKQIERTADMVEVKRSPAKAGLLQLSVEGLTIPYQMVAVERGNHWDRQIRFVLEEKNGFFETLHFVP